MGRCLAPTESAFGRRAKTLLWFYVPALFGLGVGLLAVPSPAVVGSVTQPSQGTGHRHHIRLSYRLAAKGSPTGQAGWFHSLQAQAQQDGRTTAAATWAPEHRGFKRTFQLMALWAPPFCSNKDRRFRYGSPAPSWHLGSSHFRRQDVSLQAVGRAPTWRRRAMVPLKA